MQLRTLLRPRSSGLSAVVKLCEALGSGICIVDASGKELLGSTDGAAKEAVRVTVEHEGVTLGTVIGAAAAATAVASLMMHLAAREVEGRALAGEVLHLYREIHLIEELSEQLASLLDLSAIGQLALAQAQRLIPATEGTILVMDQAKGSLTRVASFGISDDSLLDGIHPLGPTSSMVASVQERGGCGDREPEHD